ELAEGGLAVLVDLTFIAGIFLGRGYRRGPTRTVGRRGGCCWPQGSAPLAVVLVLAKLIRAVAEGKRPMVAYITRLIAAAAILASSCAHALSSASPTSLSDDANWPGRRIDAENER